MEGDISKRLVSNIRTDLGDEERNLIPNDETIYRKLTFWQNHFMTVWQTTKQEIPFPLNNDTKEYQLPANVLLITDVSFSDSAGNKLNLCSEIIQGNDGLTVRVKPDYTEGDVMTVRVYLKPEKDIKKDSDPIIAKDFHPALEKAVIMEYPQIAEKRGVLWSMSVLERFVKTTANTINSPRKIWKPTSLDKIRF